MIVAGFCLQPPNLSAAESGHHSYLKTLCSGVSALYFQRRLFPAPHFITYFEALSK